MQLNSEDSKGVVRIFKNLHKEDTKNVNKARKKQGGNTGKAKRKH